MAGMNHYAKVYARIEQDPRAHEAARLLAASEGLPEAWALHTVVGLYAAMDVWLIRETDDGVMEGDGSTVARVAAFVPPESARAAMAALVESGQEELVQLRAREARLVAELSGHRAREAWSAATPDASGVRVIVEKASAGGVDTLHPLALAVAALERALFIGTSDDPPAIMVAASKDAGINAGALLKPALASVGGRGGGSPALAQGSVPSPDQLAQVVNALRPGTQSPRGDDRSRV